MCVCLCMYECHHKLGSENLSKPSLSFHHKGLRGPTQSVQGWQKAPLPAKPSWQPSNVFNLYTSPPGLPSGFPLTDLKGMILSESNLEWLSRAQILAPMRCGFKFCLCFSSLLRWGASSFMSRVLSYKLGIVRVPTNGAQKTKWDRYITVCISKYLKVTIYHWWLWQVKCLNVTQHAVLNIPGWMTYKEHVAMQVTSFL